MTSSRSIAIIGAGPAGLFAAERLATAGHAVTVFEAMTSPARKFLFAGRGGLNLTHSEPLDRFVRRYGSRADAMQPILAAFPPDALCDWATSLGEAPFTGTSGRIFPKSFKATPLLRAWLRRLEALGVRLAPRHRWQGWQDNALLFETPEGPRRVTPAATLLALGGASWPRLGSTGGWVPLLEARGVPVAPLTPSNVGVRIDWSAEFRERYHGAPLKAAAFTAGDLGSRAEAVITRQGLEGGAIYALSPALRTGLATGAARLEIDLKPDVDAATLAHRLAGGRAGLSLSNLLRRQAGLSPPAIALLRERHGPLPREAAALATAIKNVVVPVAGLLGLERAISSAGGIPFEALDDRLMLKALPGVFVAGEMLDVDAPTGGYLLQAAFATGHAAAMGIAAYLAADAPPSG
jgi:uncharacterized flavoprotein (TIGR03862 family)